MRSINFKRFFNKSAVARFLTLTIILLLSAHINARTWYVMYNGGPSNPNTTAPYATGSSDWAHAGWGIRQTVDAAADGDEIWVAGGDVNGDGLITKADDHYRMDYTMQLTKNIKIIGGFPRPNAKAGVTEPTMADRDMVKYATIFDGSTMSGDKKLFNMTNPLSNASFDGFYVINGVSGWGAGIYMQAGLTISNCVFANNNSTDTSNPTFAGGGAVHATGGKLVNCIFTNNQAANKGGAIYLEGSATMTNCTVVNNKVTTGGNTGSAIYLYGTDCRVYNTVFWNNSGAINDVDWNGGAQASQIKNCGYNTLFSPDATNIQISSTNTTGINPPYFVTPTNTSTPGVVAGWAFATLGNWYLKNALSSLWDKGDNQYITPLSTVDIVNRPRIRNGIVDIGSYEVQPLYITGAVIAPKTYDGSANGSMSNNGSLIGVIAPDVVTINNVTVTYSDKNAANPKNVRLAYTLAGIDGGKYFVEPIDTTFKIDKRAITISADSKTKTYSNSAATDPSLTYQITSGSLVAGDNLTGSLSRVAGELVTTPGPTYQIQQGSLNASSNYALSYLPATMSITKKELTIAGISITDRTYTAGNLTAPIGSWGTLTGIIAPDAVTLTTTGITASYASDATGANKPVTFSANATLAGAQSGNYFLTMPVVTGNIGVASTVITPIYPNLVYDGNPKTVTQTHAPQDVINDIITITYYNSGSAVALAGAPKDAGIYDVKIVVSGVTYNSTKIETFTITPKPITVSVSNITKTYDNTTAATLPTLTLVGVIAADNPNVSILTNATQPSASYTSQTAGLNNRVVNITGISLTGTRAFNYNTPSSAQNITSTINKKSIVIVSDSTSKVYDGTTNVTKMPALSFSPAIMNGDVVTMSANLSNAQFDNKSAGVNKVVSITGITLSGDSLINYSIVNSCSNSNCIITRRSYPNIYINVDSVTKIYDGTRKTPLPNLKLVGIIGSDNVTVSTNSATYGLYDNKNVGKNKEAGFVGIVLGGADLSNYIISPNVTSFNNVILPRPLNDSIYIEVADTSKIFDGNTSMAVPSLKIHGLAQGDTLEAKRSTASALFDNKNTGSGKTVSVSNFTFSDPVLASNYTWKSVYTNTNSTILPKNVTVSNIKIADKPYLAGDVTATVSYWGDIVGTVAGDILKIDSIGVTASFANDAIGGNKIVTFNPIPLKLQGAQKDNYTLIQPVVKGNIGVTSTNITISNYDVVYNGLAQFVTVSTNPSDPTNTHVSYKLQGTNVDVPNPTNVGNYDVFVDVSGGSYVSSAQGTLIIRKKPIISIVPDVSREYDGTIYFSPIPTLTFSSGEIEPLDLGSITALGSIAYFDDKNVGSPKNLTVSGIFLVGSASNNYDVAAVSINTNSAITKKSIIGGAYVQADTTTKIYDGNTSVTRLPQLTVKNLIGSDVVTATYDFSTSAQFDTKDVGKGKVVTITNISLGGQDVNNYTINTTTSNINCEIKVLPLNALIYVEADTTTKYYDGTKLVTRKPSLTVKNLFGTDEVTATYDVNTTALFDTKNVGTGKTITVENIVLGGAQVKNYTISTTATNTNCEIKKRPIDASIYIDVAPASKIYDGTVISTVPELTVKGLLYDDNFSVIATTANYTNENAGSNKTVNVSDFTFSDPTMANNYTWAAIYSNTNSTIMRMPVTVIPNSGQERKFYETDPIFTFTTNPTSLPLNQTLNGSLEREVGNDVGIYTILQGTIDNDHNPNFNILFSPIKATFEIISGVILEKKWGYTLVVNNSKNEYKGYQWYKNNQLIPGQTLQWYSHENPPCGIYKVLITANDGTQFFSQDKDESSGCTAVSHTISLAPTLVKAGTPITISQGNNEINNGDAAKNSRFSIRVYSITGIRIAEITTSELNNFVIESPKTSGTYIIKINDEMSELLTQKIVVH